MALLLILYYVTTVVVLNCEKNNVEGTIKVFLMKYSKGMLSPSSNMRTLKTDNWVVKEKLMCALRGCQVNVDERYM